jgi:hypothetical protein
LYLDLVQGSQTGFSLATTFAPKGNGVAYRGASPLVGRLPIYKRSRI